PPALAERLRLRPPAVHQPPPRPHRRARPSRHHRLRHPPRRHALRPRPRRGRPVGLATNRRLRMPDHTGLPASSPGARCRPSTSPRPARHSHPPATTRRPFRNWSVMNFDLTANNAAERVGEGYWVWCRRLFAAPLPSHPTTVYPKSTAKV